MPTVIDVALKLDEVVEFLVLACTPDLILHFKPTKEDKEQRTRRERMWQVIRNFLRRALKGAYPDMEAYSYFREDEGTESGFGGSCLHLPAL